MQRNGLIPDQPEAWIQRAQSDLHIASLEVKEICLEDLCYHAQQCAEKSIKAVLLKKAGSFPYIHDLAELVNCVNKLGITVPDSVIDAVELTPYAVEGRYPGFDDFVEEPERIEAVKKAKKVLRWAERIIFDQDM